MVRGALRRWLGIGSEPERATTEPQVRHPIACDCGNTDLVILQVLVQVDARHPDVSRPTGVGAFCPKCGDSFYTSEGRRWKPRREAPAAPPPDDEEDGPPRPSDRSGPRLKWGPRGRTD